MKIKKMDKTWTLVLMIMSVSFANYAFAEKEGGGGAQIEAAFRMKGYAMITEIADNSEANSFCSASLLLSTLDAAKIDVVSRLINSTTGNPIPGNLDAWTVPGRIQLLNDSWQNLVGIHSHPFKVAQSVDVLVLHEIYRSTGTCDDNNFKISVKVDALLSGEARSNFSETFELKYQYKEKAIQEDFSDVKADVECMEGGFYDFMGPDQHCHVRISEALCDQSQNTIEGGGAQPNCLTFRAGSPVLIKNAKYFPGTLAYDDKEGDWEEMPNIFPSDFGNQYSFISPAHPLILIHDIRNGTWSYSIQ